MRAVPDKKEFIIRNFAMCAVFALGFASCKNAAEYHDAAVWKIVCAKCTARISVKCGPAVTYKGKDDKAVYYLLTGKLVKGKGCEGIAHGKFCKPCSGVTVTITGKVEDGKFTATKIVAKK